MGNLSSYSSPFFSDPLKSDHLPAATTNRQQRTKPTSPTVLWAWTTLAQPPQCCPGRTLSSARWHCRSNGTTSFLHRHQVHIVYYRRFEVGLEIKRKSSLFWKDPFYKVPSTGLLRGAFSPTSTTASAVLPQ